MREGAGREARPLFLVETSRMQARDVEARALAGDAQAQVRFAEQLDAQGRHGEAVDWLARASRSGDVDALTRLGLRLATGRDAPFLPSDGARLLSDATAAGGAEAAERLAVLVGGGFHIRQSWPMALDLLQRAAALGSASARGQLRILAAAGDDAEDWPALRQAVDLAAWTSSPSARSLSEAPRIRAIDGLVPAAACAWVIAQSSSRLARAQLYDPDSGKPVLGERTRVNRIANFTLADTSLLNLLLQARIGAATGFPQNQLESFAVLNYAVGEEYGVHVDFLDPSIPAYAAEIARMGQRVATCLVYLNDDYEGGETEFVRLGIRHRGQRGDALIFHNTDAAQAPDRTTAHAGRAPTSGEKWLLSQFIRNRPVLGSAAAGARPH